MNNFTTTQFWRQICATAFVHIYILLFTGILHRMGWIRAWPAQELLIWAKFTGEPYSYVCEWPPLKYTQTHICQKSYMGICTVPDSYSCLCERSLTQGSFTLCLVAGNTVWSCQRFAALPWVWVSHKAIHTY